MNVFFPVRVNFFKELQNHYDNSFFKDKITLTILSKTETMKSTKACILPTFFDF